MKKLIAALLILAAAGGAVAWRLGWLQKAGLALPGASPATVSNAAGQTQGGGSASTAAGNPSEAPAQGTGGGDASTGPPPFDGNVAAYDWGGRMESMTGVRSDDDLALSLPLRGKETSVAGAAPSECVISFWGREAALVDRVEIVATENASPRDVVEVWTSTEGPAAGFGRIARETLTDAPSNTVRFDPHEARFVKVRFLGEKFSVNWIKVYEAQRPGYVPLSSRRRDVLGPLVSGGPAPDTAGLARSCDPARGTAPPAPGKGQSRKVLIVSDLWTGPESPGIPFLRLKKEDRQERAPWAAELAVLDQVQFDVIKTDMARPWHLAESLGYDTVVLEQVCECPITLEASFKAALVPWVAAGHKLIVQDSDKTQPPSYAWLPYRFKTSSPGAAGAPGQYLRILEDNWMVHNRRGVPGFIDASAWEGNQPPYRNELGDTNTIFEWDPRWCGHIAVRNVNNVFGFGAAYAHYGRGLILYNGFDIDMAGTPGYDILIAREIAQGFDPDNLPCSAKMGDFIVTTDSRLLYRPLKSGGITYPLTLLSNQGWKGEVSLSATTSPGMAGVEARFDSPRVTVSDLHNVGLTLNVPANAPAKSLAVEVKGTAADGKTNTLCLQLGPPRGGELQVVSALRPPTRTGRNLEIILDASGSMKTPLAGKRSRWEVALDTLQAVLEKLPDTFNVGLRMYGHREGSRSPRTCTDTELLVPLGPLDRVNLLQQAKAFQPKGETPLVYSALQAPGDLRALGGGTVILITDGEESCKGDPVKAAAELRASGLDLRLNIVGFALKNPKAQKDLAGFAQATGGQYYGAQSGAALADALLIAAIEKFPFTIYDAAGKVAAQAEAGDAPVNLPPGDYKVVVQAGGQELVAPHVRVSLGESAKVTIALKSGQLVLQ
jgi:hypothetical protein